ncbi:hypothetical protein GE09DRAFT_967025 [Coniochaeta sp. 2T2.1]|nr:hypothetical protein GE09DRAFT_967025 [Coniochaeta sp. 2T2.1]
MTSRHVPLLPTGPPSTTAGTDYGSVSSSTRSYMRRQMTTNACVGCRKKRTKCDGKNPCSRCVARGEKCDYKAKATITKDDLRAEVETLRRERLSNRAVLNALLLDKHEAIVQRLRAGEPVHAIAQSLSAQDGGDIQHDEDEEDSKEGILQNEITTSTPLPSADDAPKAETPGLTYKSRKVGGISKQVTTGHFDFNSTTGCDIELPVWLLDPKETSGAASLPSSTSSTRRARATRRHSFSAGLTERLAIVGSTIWTKVTPNRTLLDSLIELFFCWEFPPFTMVCQEFFLRDYFDGGRQFCSPALVNAIASVATRYMEPDKVTSSGDAYLLGEQFFSESKGLLILESQVPNLPSIQTFALLAMREMSFGRELEAQELCLQAVRLLSALDFEDLERRGQLTDHLTVRCTTFLGVLSLTRAIRLITDQLSPASNYYYKTMPLVSNFSDQTVTRLWSKHDTDAKPKAADMLSNFIFDQTEYVYTFLSRVSESGNPTTIEQLPAVYQTCLESYETITIFLKEQGDSFPCTLFAHIYFHFCLLALFRPFINSAMEVAGTSPRAVCAEAVQAILDVTQSYASLFTLRRTPCFVPYFVFAAGLTRLVLESDAMTGSSPSTSSTLGLSPATVSTEARSPSQPVVADDGGDTYMVGSDSGHTSLSPTSTTLSAIGAATGSRSNSATTWSTSNTTPSATSDNADRGVTQAVQQLEAMSVGHPAAAQAGWVLRDFKPNQDQQQDYC